MLVLAFFIALVCAYYFFDPAGHSCFLKCPFKLLTGYDCAGCGAQRAFHSLLHLRLLEAFKFNPLLVVSVPFLVFVLVLNLSKQAKLKIELNNYIFDKKTIVLILIVVLVFSLLRNSDYYTEVIGSL